jgi:hypothetical protein
MKSIRKNTVTIPAVLILLVLAISVSRPVRADDFSYDDFLTQVLVPTYGFSPVGTTSRASVDWETTNWDSRLGIITISQQDFNADGVNDCLAARLGLEQVQVIDPAGTDEAGRAYGLLRGGVIPATEPTDFVQRVKTALGCEGVRYVSGNRPITKVAVGGGSCGDSLHRVHALGYDALVTADCKYNQFADGAELGMTLVDAGHFQTENPVCAYLAAKLQEQFPDLQVISSKIHKDCIKFA